MTPEERERAMRQLQAEIERAVAGLSPLEAVLLLVEVLREGDPDGGWKIEARDDRYRIVPK